MEMDGMGQSFQLFVAVSFTDKRGTHWYYFRNARSAACRPSRFWLAWPSRVYWWPATSFSISSAIHGSRGYSGSQKSGTAYRPQRPQAANLVRNARVAQDVATSGQPANININLPLPLQILQNFLRPPEVASALWRADSEFDHSWQCKAGSAKTGNGLGWRAGGSSG